MSSHKLFWKNTRHNLFCGLWNSSSSGTALTHRLGLQSRNKIVAWIYIYQERPTLVYLWVNGACILLVCVFLTLPAISVSFLTLSPGMNSKHTFMSLKSPKADVTFLVELVFINRNMNFCFIDWNSQLQAKRLYATWTLVTNQLKPDICSSAFTYVFSLLANVHWWNLISSFMTILRCVLAKSVKHQSCSPNQCIAELKMSCVGLKTKQK